MHALIRKSLSTTTLCLLLASAAVYSQWSQPSSDQIIVRGGWIFDGISDTRRRNTGIVIRNGIFAEIDANLEDSVLTATNVIDLADADTIIPSMFDLHAHYNFDLVDNGRAEEVVYNGIIFLANGVTSTWPAGEFFPERVLERRDLVDAGGAVGPRLFTSGPYFGGFRCEYDVHLRDAILMGIDRIEHQVTLGSGGPGSADMQQMIDLILEHQVCYDANLQMYGGINLRQELGAVMVWVDEARYFTPYAQELLDKRGPPLPESDEPEFAQRMLELRKLYEAGDGTCRPAKYRRA